MSTITSRSFNQDVSAAKRSAATEPVIITDRRRPSHVLMTIDDDRRLTANQRSIVEWLSVDDDLEPVPERIDLRLSIPDL